MEGSTWESLHIISNYNIKNIVIIVDRNNSDFRSIKFIKLKKRLSVFCDKISELDGHNIKLLEKVISKAITNQRSFEIIIANTIKGKGIRSMENNPEWHHKAPSKEEMKNFKFELKI